MEGSRSVEKWLADGAGWELEDKVGSDLLFVFSEPTQFRLTRRG